MLLLLAKKKIHPGNKRPSGMKGGRRLPQAQLGTGFGLHGYQPYYNNAGPLLN